MSESLGASIGDGCAVYGRQCNRGVVDNAVDDHFARGGIDGRFVGCDSGDLPGELVAFRESDFRRRNLDVMSDHNMRVTGLVYRASALDCFTKSSPLHSPSAWTIFLAGAAAAA